MPTANDAPVSAAPATEAVRAQRAISVGVVLFRWAALAWMAGLAVLAGRFARPGLAWGLLGILALWTAWTSAPRVRQPWTPLGAELALAVTVVVLSGVVVERGAVVERPLFATAWPLATVIAWAVSRGPLAGAAAGAAVGAALVASRLVNGLSPYALSAEQVQVLANGVITFLLAGVTVGVAARALERSADEAQRLLDVSMRERERAARLAEREALAREIHDSVLQSLTMVHKRGREMASQASVPAEQVRALADTAAQQADELRALITREPEEPPTGRASLRDALERAARTIDGMDIAVSAVGPTFVPAHDAAELAAAATQALHNVREHAAATRVAVFAEADDGWVTVTVRDDGRGFVFDEAALRAAGKAGLLNSIRGRVEALGGEVRVDTGPGAGTEIEMRVPQR